MCIGIPIRAPQMIQVDMFEVQLGASILLQFKNKEGKIIRVLADAGVGKGLPTNHVHDKLTAAFNSFGSQDRRIDLIIGTHYDADHLNGLVPIIKDESIAISEAWLPPVANDTELHSIDESVADHNLLPKQFYSDEDHQILFRYLGAKRDACKHLTPSKEEAESDDWWNERDVEGALKWFKEHRAQATKFLGVIEGQETHADDEQFAPLGLSELLEMYLPRDLWIWLLDRAQWLHDHPNEITRSLSPRSTRAYNLAGIRMAAASDAINAISLKNVVDALRARSVPVFCRIIPNGTPLRFVWRTGSERFECGRHLSSQGPVITLFGPSEGLVRKRWNRLPIGAYAAFASLALAPIKQIVPSNQLSYVARFEAEKQGILITGDAGFVDFKPRPTSRHYYPELLSPLLPLHVVQVAHHAGNNAHFYRVLACAGYPKRVRESFLLVSHATHDLHRPSREFNQFVQNLRRNRKWSRILFTAQPLSDKSYEFKSLVHPVVGTAATKGDARLSFQRGAWNVTKHAIKV